MMNVALPHTHGVLPRMIAGRVGLSVWQLAVLALVLAGSARAEDAATVSKQDVQAKLAYCEVCHGVSAQGFHGYYPIPRLAGQQTEYLENQLQAFVDRSRTNNIMFNVGHVLSPAMIAALAADFKDLDPKPLGGGAKEMAAGGKKIFDEGVPDAKVPACASCHGPDAKATGRFPVWRVSLPTMSPAN